MRRLLIALTALGLIASSGPRPEPLWARDCTQHCGEQAAANCDDIDSLECGFYIVGCLAGCKISQF